MFDNYDTGNFYDEVFAPPPRTGARPHYAAVLESLNTLQPTDYSGLQRSADKAFLQQGVTFTVYGDEQGTERIFPFDLMPRIIPRRGMGPHRSRPHPAHHRAQSLPPRRLPRAAKSSRTASSRRALRRIRLPFPPRVHRRRRAEGHLHPHLRHRPHPRRRRRILVLEDNGRCPSGASYMLENRQRHEARLPAACSRPSRVRPVDAYGAMLRKTLRSPRAARRASTRSSSSSRPASTTAPTSSTAYPRPPDGHPDRGGPRPRRAR